MRHDAGYAAALADDRIASASGVTFRVEIGIRLVEDDQKRFPVKRARQGNPLALPGRKRGIPLTDFGLVSLGKTQIIS